MGTFMRKEVFTERVIRGLKNWHEIASQNLAPQASGSANQTAPSSSHNIDDVSSMVPSPSCTINTTPVSDDVHEASFLDLGGAQRGAGLAVREIVEEDITPNTSNRGVAYDGELSFQWLNERGN